MSLIRHRLGEWLSTRISASASLTASHHWRGVISAQNLSHNAATDVKALPEIAYRKNRL